MEEMFKKYSPMVFRYLKVLCGDEDALTVTGHLRSIILNS